MNDLAFDPATWRKSGQAMEEAAQTLVTRYSELMGQVGDSSVLGNDDVGALMTMVYDAVLARVAETVESVAQAYGVNGAEMVAAGDSYEMTEAQAAAASEGLAAMLAERPI